MLSTLGVYTNVVWVETNNLHRDIMYSVCGDPMLDNGYTKLWKVHNVYGYSESEYSESGEIIAFQMNFDRWSASVIGVT